MSYFDDASLVMIPSGYKDQKVYSVKPLDGSGDLTFTRASDATRVASNGLIEKVRTNLVLQSNNFSSASWTNNALVTPNNQTSPDGTLDADTFTADGTNSGILQVVAVTNVPHTFSIYAKAGTYSIFRIVNLSSLTNAAWFDLSTNTTGNQVGGTSKIEAVGNGWYRCSYSTNLPNTSAGSQGFVLSDAMGSTGGVPSGSTMYFWKAQIETGDIATDPITTLGTAVSVGPVSGLPRLDYLNSTCPRLLLEPQRSNIALYSEQFDNADWTKLNATVTANQTQDPTGYDGADKLIQTTATAEHSIYNTISVTSGTTYAGSVFLKMGDGSTSWRYAQVRFRNGGFGTGGGVVVDLLNGAITYSSGLASSSIESYGNGWYRVSIVQASTVTSASAGIVVAFNDTSNSFSVSFAGDTNANMFLFGAQIEAGSYSTSYLNTLSTSVTRVADSASKTGISSLIGQTEGTVFLEFEISTNTGFNSQYPALIDISDGTSSNRFSLLLNNASFSPAKLQLFVVNGSATQASITASASITTGRHKVAFAYALNNYAVYMDGVLIGTDTSATVPACSKVALTNFDGTFVAENKTSQALLFKTRLTNAQLAELTTL
jgi:hypothetical protein